MAAKVDQLAAKVDQLAADMDWVKAKMGEMETMMAGIKAGQDNVVHRNINGNSRMLDHKLQPLKAEEGEHVGKYPNQPDPFPETLWALMRLDAANLDALQQFYGREFKGTTLEARRDVFVAFTGALSSRP
ncbi:hypothetical protein HYH02_012091 [Chlamydomonas schloesseri]|uniref:Uncharacterized protein n=1 Tax=Chlamydomonas schloesseri TaxID=2026947 RepID=A0A835W3U0_9CHLO|nr:hypothetical protein HYH02_012091 [Chlamydomonas schloesseri]|eukprot:KAG2434891.1 hypothetical protein HYH02_012091 [Chlamydomonas schloesseri]